jgi:hypothetical protein
MTHLQAFCSDDAKRGRVWTDGYYEYMRLNTHFLQYRMHGENVNWEIERGQVAAMEGHVTWADEPKTLTPGNYIMRLKQDGSFDVQYGDGTWGDAREFGLVIKKLRPSQPAEPAKPPLKVGDRVNVSRKSKATGIIGRCGPGMVTHVDHGGKTVHVLLSDELGPARSYSLFEDSGFNIEKIEAEPQVEYPLTYDGAVKAALEGHIVESNDEDNFQYRGVPSLQYRISNGKWTTWDSCDAWGLSDKEKATKWRIVPTEGK